MSLIGAPLRRREDPKLVRGSGRFTGDIRVPGMLHAVFVRSPYARAQVESVSLERARTRPGVSAVVGAADMEVLGRPLPITFPQPDATLRTPSPLAAREGPLPG